MIKHCILILAAAGILSSCSVTRQVEYREVTARNIEPKLEALVVPLKGEIEVMKDSDGKFMKVDELLTYKLDNPAISVATIQENKKIALNEVAQKYNADLIVGALTDVKYETLKNGAQLLIRVTGYPAVFVNFKNLDASDATIIDYYLRSDIQKDNAAQRRNQEGIIKY